MHESNFLNVSAASSADLTRHTFVISSSKTVGLSWGEKWRTLNRPWKSRRLFCIGVPDIAHLVVARKAAMACEVEVLWLRIICAGNINTYSTGQPCRLTFIKNDTSPVMSEQRSAVRSAITMLSFDGLIGGKYYVWQLGINFEPPASPRSTEHTGWRFVCI